VKKAKKIMSTQSYYKDRLGFDPREALYDGPVKGGSRSHSREHSHTVHSQSHYSSTSNGNDHYATPPKKSKQQNHHAAYQQQHEGTPQGGYEDALSQFKGSMSVWEYFVENSDKMGMSVGV
jgi:hypothetical protein